MFKSIKTRRYFIRLSFFLGIVVCTLLAPMVKGAIADENDSESSLCPKGKIYQLHKKESGYVCSESYLLKDGETLPFGRRNAGKFSLTGDSAQPKNRLNDQGYTTNGKIIFNYSYDGSLSDKDKKEWQLYDDDQKKVNGFTLTREIKKGTIIIEKSYDNVTWTVEDYYTNFFDKHKEGMQGIYETKEDDVKHGVYYRVTVAYTVRQCTDSHKVDFTGWFDDYDYEECVEVYSFYVGTMASSLHIHDVFTGEDVTRANVIVQDGFSVKSDSPFSTIFVQEPGGYEKVYSECSVFTKQGEYAIRLRDAFGEVFKYSVKVSGGVDMQEIIPAVYETNSSYESPSITMGLIGAKNLTSLFVEQFNGHTIIKSAYNGKQAFSVDGEGVSLYLQLNYGKELGNGWTITSDSYGGTDGQKLYASTIGKIETGALIIQTSKDGNNWENIEKGRYKDGLYTTDFMNCYGGGRRIQVYTPNGTEVLNGMYVRVVYAYEMNKQKETKNIVEEYTFYLSNSNTDAVVFHNKSVEGELQEILSEEDQTTIDIYRKAETLADNTQTLTGFSIDVSQNPTVEYEVRRNKEPMVGSTTTFTESGKYDITLKAVGKTKQLTIFVDRDSSEESLKKYFDKGFLEGHRIYAETGYPVYVAGQTTYKILSPDNMLPVSGTILNKTTGKEITIDATWTEKNGTIMEAGEYEAKFYTNKTFAGDNPVGDTKIFTFHFIMIDPKDIPGPVVNKRSLSEYTKTNISDLCPKYYGITYPSAGKGYITLAFATQEDAVNYAYEHEKGEVEKQPDGSYRYKGSCQMAQKEKYESTWALTDAITFFARQAVKEYYFDMSETFSYLTLPSEVLEKESNLRKLELSDSVIVFAPGQKDKLLATEGLPIISPKKYAILDPEKINQITSGASNDYVFVKDDSGYDSEKVLIFDCEGKSYVISYDKGVGKQLQDLKCESGVVSILEMNKHGDKSEYKAVFLREGDNLAAVTFKTYIGEKETDITIDKDSETRHFQAEAFRPLTIVDETDKYSYVKISHNGQEECMLSTSMGEKMFSEPGDYTIRCINRLGYSFEFTITIQDGSKFTVLRCMDDKGEIQEVYTSKGSRDVRLPEYMRTGYQLVGYIDAKGNHYPLVLSEVNVSGSLSLTAEWQPKDCKVVIVDQNGNRVLDIPAKFHDMVDLKAKCEEKGLVASTWSRAGIPIENGIIEIDTEGEMIIVAVVESSHRTTIWIYYVLGTVVIVGVALIGVVVSKGKRRMKGAK